MAINKESMRRLIKSDDFQELLKILALKIRELDTIRDIDTDKVTTEKIAINQIARKIAIDTIELWLSEIFNIINFDEFSSRHIEKRDDIIGRLEEEKNKQ